MNQYDKRIELDVFKSQTTYQNDFKKLPFDNKSIPASDCYQKRTDGDGKKKQPKPHVLRDNETYAFWRPNVYIPFNLLWRPKEIIQTNPYEPFITPVVPEGADKSEAIKTRPRIYKSPAISMDDIEEPEVRKILCDNMYTSETTKAIKESKVQATKRHIPNTTIEMSGDPVRLKVDVLPPLPNTFRMKGKKWEDNQLKVTVDPTKTFWEHKDPPVKCGACSDPVKGLVADEVKEQIRELIQEDRLRLVHDAPIPGYAGFKPRFSGCVSLAKVDMPVVHPFMSVTQAITKRYVVDKS